MIQEQRQSPRKDNQCPIYYTFPGDSERYSGQCINLSNNGILLECDQQLQLETALEVCLITENATTTPLNMLVKINWLHKQQSGLYHAGASIKAIIAMHETANV
ncbi:MAG: PilZ domain-containing protein [Methylococcales bacterium]